MRNSFSFRNPRTMPGLLAFRIRNETNTEPLAAITGTRVARHFTLDNRSLVLCPEAETTTRRCDLGTNRVSSMLNLAWEGKEWVAMKS